MPHTKASGAKRGARWRTPPTTSDAEEHQLCALQVAIQSVLPSFFGTCLFANLPRNTAANIPWRLGWSWMEYRWFWSAKSHSQEDPGGSCCWSLAWCSGMRSVSRAQEVSWKPRILFEKVWSYFGTRVTRGFCLQPSPAEILRNSFYRWEDHPSTSISWDASPSLAQQEPTLVYHYLYKQL